MKAKQFTKTFSFVLIFALSSRAQDLRQNSQKPINESGVVLMDYCQWVEPEEKNADEWSQQTICIAYLSGIVEGYYSTKQKPPSFCFPKDVTGKQEALVVLKYLRDHPERLHLRSNRLVIEAMTKSFPCRQ
jgi:Rap1a immunity proteins